MMHDDGGPSTASLDPDVVAAMARWPGVPDVHGWLSLDARGRWRLHDDGRADDGGPGGTIGNAQIRAFIDRNYRADADGRWYFQNGPQRVFVRLDAAPLIARLDDAGLRLVAHTGRPISRIDGWLLDDAGRLFARTGDGPALVLDRDLAAVAAQARLDDGRPLLEALADDAAGKAACADRLLALADYPARPLARAAAADVPRLLGFVTRPEPLSPRSA